MSQSQDNDNLFNLVTSLARTQAEIVREASRDKFAVELQLRQRIEELERLADVLYEACEALEAHYDAQLPYGHRSPLLVEARRAMERARELRK